MSRVFALSEAASIALHSMVLIARAENGINVLKIAEITGFSKNHIAKVLQRLVKEGLLKSVRGPSGGFSLKGDPKKISLLDVYEVIEGPIQETDCPLTYEVCNYDKCILGNIINEMTGEFKKYMKTNTLESYK
jgi:Rrf2 family protein